MARVNAVGRRKASIARVYLEKGKGKISVNGTDYKEYFPVVHLRNHLDDPFKAIDAADAYDVVIKVNGGGKKGQAEAIKLGIARALIKLDEELRPTLKKAGYLFRDPRVVERKKPGLRKARKRDQFSKR
ncbi:MAG: 30S ribosomal protein S9 [Chitinophagales bacterium]